jgi:hypothetical protein
VIGAYFVLGDNSRLAPDWALIVRKNKAILEEVRVASKLLSMEGDMPREGWKLYNLFPYLAL